MNDKLIASYVEIDNQIAQLEAKKEAIREKVMAQMKKDGMQKMVGEGIGTFSLMERTTWKYPANVLKAEVEVKGMKKQAEIDGTAKAEVKEVLRFQAAKEGAGDEE